ncbi:hypothetical protein A0H81_03546 [Grifola frondosa]|uniref:Uncharacterized protein n=1 Tax=Grifola frondosa TaxID=5627 RepID=A0A1C7MKB7_GRIFR|nr:hypothetical protein A0H81_03546 [Grifola frondosa]
MVVTETEGRLPDEALALRFGSKVAMDTPISLSRVNKWGDGLASFAERSAWVEKADGRLEWLAERKLNFGAYIKTIERYISKIEETETETERQTEKEATKRSERERRQRDLLHSRASDYSSIPVQTPATPSNIVIHAPGTANNKTSETPRSNKLERAH